MDTVIAQITTGSVVGGLVTKGGGYATSPTAKIDSTEKAFATFNLSQLSPFVVAQMQAGNFKVVLNFTTHTSSIFPETLHVYAGSNDDAVAAAQAQIATPSGDHAKTAWAQLQPSSSDEVASIGVRKGVPPFSSDQNQNAAQSVDITAEVLDAFKHETTSSDGSTSVSNLLVWFTFSDTGSLDEVDVSNLSLLVSGLALASTDFGSPSLVVTSQPAYNPFAGANAASTVPAAYLPNPDGSINIPYETPGGTSTAFLDNSIALTSENRYQIIQSNAAAGKLSGPGLEPTPLFVGAGQAGYFIYGTTAEIAAKLQALIFVPASGTAGQAGTTTFQIFGFSAPGTAIGPPVPLPGGLVSLLGGTDTNRTIGPKDGFVTADTPMTLVVLGGGHTVGATLYTNIDGHYDIVQAKEIVSGGGRVDGTVLVGATLEVQSGGSATGTVIGAKSLLQLQPGGLSFTPVTVSGMELVEANGRSSQAHVLTGGDQLIQLGGWAEAATIDAGGTQEVYGTAYTTTVNGVQTVKSGGVTTGTTIGSGGTQLVYSGGRALSSLVSSGGSLTVYGGGSVSDLSVAGGTAILKNGATASGTITLIGTSTLEVDAPIAGSSIFAATISGLTAGSAIDFAGLSYTSLSRYTISGSRIIITNGTATETLNISSSTVNSLQLSDDGAGGTLITVPLSFTTGSSVASAVAPLITGGRNSVVKGGDSLLPFYGVQVSDSNPGSSEKITIRMLDGGVSGTLSGPGLTGGANGTYSLTGSADAVTTALGQIKFTAKTLQPNTSVSTGFSLIDTTTAGTAATNTAFSVTVNTAAASPKIAGSATLATVSEAPVTPFASAVVTDPNANSTDVLTIELSGGAGVLSGAGLAGGGNGVYTLSGTSTQVTAALQALTFTPAAGAPGQSTTAKFKLTDVTTPGLKASSISFSVTNTDPAVAPTLTGAAAVAVQSEAASTPFATAALIDPNFNSTDTLTIQLSNGGAGGALSGAGLSGGAGGTYTLSGSAVQVMAALQALVFTPAKGAPGTSTTTTFTLTDTTTQGTSASNAGFSVTNTDPPPATITSDTASPGTGAFGVGQQITFTLAASAAVTVTGTPTLVLNDGGTASYDPTQSTAASLVFRTTVAAGQNAATLAVTGVTLPGGASIRDSAGNDAVLTGASASFAGLQVDTIAPTVTVALASDTGLSSTDGITSNGMLGGRGEPNGLVTISNGAAVLGTAPTAADGSWSFRPTLVDGRYTLTASQTDAAGNVGKTMVSLTLNTATPTNTLVPAPVAEKGTSPTVLATVAPGTAGDTLVLSQTGGTGILSLGPVRNGVQQVLYAATASSGQDTVRYTISDQQSGVSTPGLTVVQLDPGPTAGTATSTVKLGSSTNLTSVILGAVNPGLRGDTLTLTADNATGTLGAVFLVNGQLTYAASGSLLQHIKANGSAADSFTYTVSDQYGGTAVGTVKLTVTNPATAVNGPAYGNGTIQGTSGTDIITASGWNNTIYDNGGNDVVNAGQGSATVYTAGGDVVVNLNGFNNVVQGFAKAGAAGAAGADGNVTVSGSQGLTAVKLGDGKNTVSLGGWLNAIEVGNGQNTIVAGAGGDLVKAGSGNNTIKLAGFANAVTLGAGTDVVNGGSGDIIAINGTTLALKGGFAETVLLGPGTSSLDDLSSGTRVVVGKTSGSLSISDFAKDPGFMLNLTEGVGGFKTASSVVAALRTDGHGGTLLMLGTGTSATTIDFLNTPSSVLTAGHFRIG